MTLLADEPHLIGAIQLECGDGEVEGLLHARAGVVQKRQQRVIAPTARRVSIFIRVCSV